MQCKGQHRQLASFSAIPVQLGCTLVHPDSFRFTQVHSSSFSLGLIFIKTVLGGRIILSIGRAGVICATGFHTADIPTTGLGVWV